jgi:twitching motility protein PilI
VGGPTQQHPLTLLRDLEQRARSQRAQFPRAGELKEAWIGIGFSIGGVRLVLPVDQVREVLPFPRMCRVPGTKGWVRGLANVRGRLLTVVDLGGFLRGQPTSQDSRNRILALRDEALSVGLWVEEVLGMKHFLQEDYRESSSLTVAWLVGYVGGTYRRPEGRWHVLDLRAVLDSQEFLQPAI